MAPSGEMSQKHPITQDNVYHTQAKPSELSATVCPKELNAVTYPKELPTSGADY